MRKTRTQTNQSNLTLKISMINELPFHQNDHQMSGNQSICYKTKTKLTMIKLQSQLINNNNCSMNYVSKSYLYNWWDNSVKTLKQTYT